MEHDQHDDKPIATGDWLDRVDTALRWLNGRAAILAGWLLFIAVIYQHSFIRDEQVPLSIASPSLFATIPAFLALLFLFIALLLALLCMPTMMLFVPLRKEDGERLVDRIGGKKGDPSRLGWPLVCLWGGLTLAIGLAVLGLTCLPSAWLVHSDFWMPPVLIVFGGLMAALFIGMSKRVLSLSIRWRQISPDYWFVAAVSVFPQLILLSYGVGMARQSGDAEGSELSATTWIIFISISLALGLAQLLAARVIASATHPDQSMVKSILVALIVVTMLGLYTPIAGRLAGTVFSLTASGGRPCAQLLLKRPDGSSDGSIEWANSPEKVLKSPSVKVLLEADGYYRVRLRDGNDQSIRFIPSADVIGMVDCPPPVSPRDKH